MTALKGGGHQRAVDGIDGQGETVDFGWCRSCANEEELGFVAV